MAIQTALVVDDSRSARYILQRLLERQHISVEGVGSAREALSYLREYLPDVVFMDDMMPGMEGQEAIDRLALNPATAKIPIVMYTARDYSATEVPLQGSGIVGVLSKPFTPQDVDDLLQKLGGTLKPPPVTAKLVRQTASVVNMSEPAPKTVTECIEIVAPKLETAVVSELVPAELKKAALAALAAHESRIVPTLHSVADNAAPGVAQKIETHMHAAHHSKSVVEAVAGNTAQPVERVDSKVQLSVDNALQLKQEQFEESMVSSLDSKLSALQSGLVERVESEVQRVAFDALHLTQKQLEENMSLSIDTRLAALRAQLVEHVDGRVQHAVGDALQLKQQQHENNISSSVESKLSELQSMLVERVESETRRALDTALRVNQDNFEKIISEAMDAKLAVMQSQMVQQKNEMQRTVEQMIGELFANGVRPHIQQMEECMRQAMIDLRYELSVSQEQVLEQRIPYLLDALEQRQRQRVDVLHSALITSMENAAAVLSNLSR